MTLLKTHHFCFRKALLSITFTVLYNLETSWQKKNTNTFDVAMTACDGAEICEILDLFLLYNLENKPKKKTVFLVYIETTDLLNQKR